MKFKPLLFLAPFVATALPIAAQPVWLGGPANPVTNTITFPRGWSLIANPLLHSRGKFVSNAVPDNTVGELFSKMPHGTVLLKFDSATQEFAPRNVFRRGRWSSPGQTLVPGEGAWLFNPLRKPLEIVFTGDLSYGSVTVPSGMSLISSPGPGPIDFAVPPGPFGSTGTQFNPQEGDVVYTFAGRRGGFVRHRFRNGSWDTVPILRAGEDVCDTQNAVKSLVAEYESTRPRSRNSSNWTSQWRAKSTASPMACLS